MEVTYAYECRDDACHNTEQCHHPSSASVESYRAKQKEDFPRPLTEDPVTMQSASVFMTILLLDIPHTSASDNISIDCRYNERLRQLK